MNKLGTKKDVMKAYGVSKRTVDAWMAQKKIPYLKIGYVVRFDMEKVDASLRRFTIREAR